MHIRTKAVGILIALLAALGISLANASTSFAAPAQTQTAASNSAVSSGPLKGAVIGLPNGNTVTLPKNWSQMTVADAAKLGIHPNMAPSQKLLTKLASEGVDVTKSANTTSPAATIHPDSASGCNVNVCISLTGSGTVVDTWETEGYNSAEDPFCTFSVYWLGGDVLDTGENVCGGLGWYVGYLGYGIATGGTIQACNSWISISGYPCETIHP